MTRRKQDFRKRCSFIKKGKLKYNIYISVIFYFYRILSWCIFGSNYSLKFFWVWRALHIWIWGFSPILLWRCSQALSGWMGPSVDSHFQVSTEMFGWVHVLAACFGLSSCCKVTPRPRLRSWALWTRFSPLCGVCGSRFQCTVNGSDKPEHHTRDKNLSSAQMSSLINKQLHWKQQHTSIVHLTRHWGRIPIHKIIYSTVQRPPTFNIHLVLDVYCFLH